MTQVGTRFPKFEKNSKHQRPTMRVTEYKANCMKTRQLSLQHSPTTNIRKTGGSSLSLSDDIICESSLRSLLALEDMRGERTSAFSRGLKNLKHLPKRVIQIKSKFSDSFDDESDQDSTYSSTWSVVGSDSTRSSIADLRQSIRRKKFTHKKIAQESGIAALLIRSVHTGFPLDSVREDRETPTPSPVNLLVSRSELPEGSKRPIKCIDDFNDIDVEKNLHHIPQDDDFLEKTDEHYQYSNSKTIIPMISSSETDTSTSDEEDEEEDDEPSESSTNYKMLDDTFSTIESSLFEDTKLCVESICNAVISAEIKSSLALDNNELVDSSMELRQNSMPEGLILDCDVVPVEIFVPLISSIPSTSENQLINNDLSLPSGIKTPNLRTSPSFKLKILGKQMNFDSNEELELFATSTPLNEEESTLQQCAVTPILSTTNLFSSVDLSIKSSTPSLIDLTIESKESLLSTKIQSDDLTVLHDETIIVPLSPDFIKNQSTKDLENKEKFKVECEQNYEETSDESSSTESLLPYKKYLFQTTSVESRGSIEKKEKSYKKIARTDTVIYKGPSKDKEKPCAPLDHKDITGKSIKTMHIPATTTTSPTIIVAPPSEPDCHLRVPMADTKDIKVHSPYPQDNSKKPDYDITSYNEYFLEPQLMSERFKHKFRQHSMLDLIKTIDAKMMVHDDLKDSTKNKKRRDRGNLNSTPSPDSIRRSKLHRKNSRSKSPEKHHHHHHHHHTSHHSHPTSPLVVHSVTYPINTGKPSPPLTPVKESQLSCVSSTENLSNNNTAHCMNDPYPLCAKNPLYPCNIFDNSDETEIHEIAAKQLTVDHKNDLTHEIIAIPLNVIKAISDTNTGTLLSPGEVDPSVHKSHSEGNLGKFKNNLTKITNTANDIDNVCVPCPPLTARQQEEQSASPVHPAPGYPASMGTKVTNSPAPKTPLHRRSSDSDLSITPKGKL